MVVDAHQLPRPGLHAGIVDSGSSVVETDVVVVVVVVVDEVVPVGEEMLDVPVVSEVPVVAEPSFVWPSPADRTPADEPVLSVG